MEALNTVADGLFELVIDLDPARTTWVRLSENARGRVRVLMNDLARSLEELRDIESARAIREALITLSHSLTELADALNNSPNAERWRRLYARLAKNYDELATAVAQSSLIDRVRLRRLTPKNYTRNIFHIVGGVMGAVTYHYLLDHQTAIILMASLVVVFTTIEVVRRRSDALNDLVMRLPFLKHVARPREYYEINSSTYYAYGMLVAVLAAPDAAVEAACLVLAFGDPAASNLGRRFGRVKIFRDKSVVGTMAFFGFAFLAVVIWQLVAWSVYPVGLNLGIAATAAAVGAIAEALTVRLDDNLTVPLSVALGVGILLFIVGAL